VDGAMAEASSATTGGVLKIAASATEREEYGKHA